MSLVSVNFSVPSPGERPTCAAFARGTALSRRHNATTGAFSAVIIICKMLKRCLTADGHGTWSSSHTIRLLCLLSVSECAWTCDNVPEWQLPAFSIKLIRCCRPISFECTWCILWNYSQFDTCPSKFKNSGEGHIHANDRHKLTSYPKATVSCKLTPVPK